MANVDVVTAAVGFVASVLSILGAIAGIIGFFLRRSRAAKSVLSMSPVPAPAYAAPPGSVRTSPIRKVYINIVLGSSYLGLVASLAALFVIVYLVQSACPAQSQSCVSQYYSTTHADLWILATLLSMLVWVVLFVVAWVMALARAARLGQWGWFLGLFLFFSPTIFFYAFLG